MAAKLDVLTSSKMLNRSYPLRLKYYDSYETYYERVKDFCIEEMSELTKALLKERRGREVQENIKDEIYDVIMNLSFLVQEKGITKRELSRGVSKKALKMIG